MARNHTDYYRKLQDISGRLADGIPGPMKAFTRLHQKATIGGALDSKIKELIALGIAVTVRCNGCISFHVHDALEAGATEDEIMETIGVATLKGKLAASLSCRLGCSFNFSRSASKTAG